MRNLILIAILSILLFSCHNNSTEPYFKDGYDYVQLTPDSLRSPEQNELIDKLSRILVENIAAKNDKMIFLLSEEEFVAKGIPVEYYELIQKDLVNNNKFFKEHNITNIDSIIKESYKEIRDSFKNNPPITY